MAKARCKLTGIRERHGRSCPAATDPEARCSCEPTYEAAVWARRDGQKIRKTFASIAEARRWRTAMQKLSDDGGLRAPPALSLDDAATAWLEGAARGAIRNRSGDPYKPSALRGYEQAFRLRICPALGAHKLGEITRSDLQRLVARWQEQGLSPSSIRNTVNALRALYQRRFLERIDSGKLRDEKSGLPIMDDVPRLPTFVVPNEE